MSAPALHTPEVAPSLQPQDVMVIVWAPEEQRTESIARMLKAQVFHVHFLKYKTPLYAPFKYPLQALKTWQLLFRHRPRIIYVTNPPIFAPMAVYAYCKLTGAKLIMDTHPPALYMKKWAWSGPLQRWMARRAFLNISDQERFKRVFDDWGAAPTIVFEKPLTAVASSGATSPAPDPATFEVAVINTFAEDEPLHCVIEAARLRPDVRFFITGNTSKADPAVLRDAPSNCVFTGYLLGDAYWSMLRGRRAVMALTDWQHSLMAAALDGVMLHKPTLISRQETSMEYFNKGAVFVDNTGPGIAAGIEEAQRRESELIRETQEFIEERQAAWETNFSQLQKLIDAELAQKKGVTRQQGIAAGAS